MHKIKQAKEQLNYVHDVIGTSKKKKKEAPKKIYTKETKLSEVGKHWECMEN